MLSAGRQEEDGAAIRRAYWMMHACVLLWGLTAILGKLISIAALPLVLWRLVLVLGCLALLPACWRGLRGLSAAQWGRAALAGVFVSLHWWTFYAAIKLANASVAVACMAVTPIFLSVLEPWLTKRPFRALELALGALAMPGVWLVVGGSPPEMNLGVAVGLLSSLLVAMFSTLNKTLARDVDPFTLTAIEFGAGALLLLGIGLLLPPPTWWPEPRDWLWLSLLASACTLVPFVLAILAMRSLSAWAVHLVINLEPVYAIALAVLFLGEGAELQPPFYWGTALLILVTFVSARLSRARSAGR